MIEVSRRNFLIGGSAAVTALMLSPQLKALDGIINKGIITPRIRRVYDILISCDPIPRDVAINHVIHKNNHVMLAMRMNARASFRWVAPPGGEILYLKSDVMRYEVDPCTDGMQMCFMCEDGNGIKLAEYFKWEKDKLVQVDCSPLSYPFEQWVEAHTGVRQS